MVGFLQKEHKERMDMLNRDKIFVVIILLFFSSCINTELNEIKEKRFFNKANEIIGKNEYASIFNKMKYLFNGTRFFENYFFQ